MAASKRTLSIISGCLMCFACVLYIISNGIPLWGVPRIGASRGSVGLWRTCGPTETGILCFNLPLTCSEEPTETLSMCHKLIVARAFITTACIISALSLLSLFACALINTDISRIVIIISKILTLASFTVGIVGVAVGIAFVSFDLLKLKIGEAAIVAIIAVSTNGIAAVICLAIQ